MASSPSSSSFSGGRCHYDDSTSKGRACSFGILASKSCCGWLKVAAHRLRTVARSTFTVSGFLRVQGASDHRLGRGDGSGGAVLAKGRGAAYRRGAAKSF